ncbi:hypothetical protein L2E82_13855 [Cichorium intybus]|uniref:Uncharacterized protein n=1 Tax=Cichorium intybus TaxID=13427 RepID=A0ACB9EZM1_CICIN|nr:hypothetical protein L1887_33502 [Cichorium endivia]KAI3763857.1 hypothetical protein L2E82_13855 [Cichorium intybus]
MESLKKKRSEVSGDRRLPGKKNRANKERSDGGGTADDAELEEFFAILKRLQAGFNYFQKKGADDFGGRSATPPPATGWDPDFELEDFKEVDDGSRETTVGEALKKETLVGFDLNADPETDQNSEDLTN